MRGEQGVRGTHIKSIGGGGGYPAGVTVPTRSVIDPATPGEGEEIKERDREKARGIHDSTKNIYGQPSMGEVVTTTMQTRTTQEKFLPRASKSLVFPPKDRQNCETECKRPSAAGNITMVNTHRDAVQTLGWGCSSLPPRCRAHRRAQGSRCRRWPALPSPEPRTPRTPRCGCPRRCA